MVTTVTPLMNHCTPVNLSFIGRIGTIVVPFPGWKVIRSSTQIRRMEIMQTGRATKNQTPQLGWGRIFWRAIMFCGEAMGEAAPPILEARAIPRMRALEKLESEGKLRRSGWTKSDEWLINGNNILE